MDEQSLISEALKRSDHAERASFLDQVCQGDSDLRERLAEQLIRHDEQPVPTLDHERTDKATVDFIPLESRQISEGPGTMVGPYRLMEQIGEGGFGRVFVAAQEQPVRRRVALKLIKPGMDTHDVIARFEAERQALALMDHHNIAKVLDAGATASGRPYFVMELVRGIPITDYCDQNRLTPRERLALFITVCHAVQHAHQKGIIHRDIKPSNVLVTLHDGQPVVKVIDFGIAKALHQRLTERTIYTQFAQLIGTPLYMSPEQAEMSGLDIDTRSDIYSLGVLLYELLTGCTPFDKQRMATAAYDEIRRIFREEEPPKPSTRLSRSTELLASIAAERKTEPSKLSRLLQGDLDWIVMKCLEKDRTRRYETANGLAVDIERHLSNEPVVARPPSSFYRFQKLVRRNKAAFTSTVLVALSLLAGLTFSTVSFFRERDAHRRAVASEQEQSRLRKAAEFAQEREAALRQTAEREGLIARRNLYASDLNLVQLAFQSNNFGRARRLLDRHLPQPSQEDLRGWEWRYAWQRCQSSARLSVSPSLGDISAVRFLPESKRIIATSLSKGAVICELSEPPNFLRVQPFEKSSTLDVSRDGALIATAEEDGNVKVWDQHSMKLRATLRHPYFCTSVGFSPDGRLIATACWDGTTRIWEWEQASARHVFKGPGNLPAYAGKVAFSADGSRFVFGGGEGGLRLADTNTGAEQWKTKVNSEFVTALAYSPDGQTIASGSGYSETTIRLWDAATGNPIGSLPGHTGWISGLVYSPDARRLASSSSDQTVRIWDPTELKQLAVLRGHINEVRGVAYSSDGLLLVSGDRQDVIHIWDAAPEAYVEPPLVLPGKTIGPCFSRDGGKMYLINDGVVQMRDSKSLKVIERYAELGNQNGSFALSPDDSLLAVWDLRDRIRIWDLEKREIVTTLASPIVRLLDLIAPDRRHRDITFSSDGKILSTVRVAGEVNHYSTSDWKVATSWQLPSNSFNRLSVFPKQSLIVSQHRDGVKLLNLMTGALEKDLVTHQEVVDGVDFSPDDRWLAIGAQDGSVKIFDTQNWTERHTLRGHLAGVHGVAFSPDGKRLLSGSNGREAVKIWDTETWQELATLEAQGSLFKNLHMSPNGTTLSAATYQNQINLWQAPAWGEIEAANQLEAIRGAAAVTNRQSLPNSASPTARKADDHR